MQCAFQHFHVIYIVCSVDVRRVIMKHGKRKRLHMFFFHFKEKRKNLQLLTYIEAENLEFIKIEQKQVYI